MIFNSIKLTIPIVFVTLSSIQLLNSQTKKKYILKSFSFIYLSVTHTHTHTHARSSVFDNHYTHDKFIFFCHFHSTNSNPSIILQAPVQ